MIEAIESGCLPPIKIDDYYEGTLLGKNVIKISPLRKLMRYAGAEFVEKGAVEQLQEQLTAYSAAISALSQKVAAHSKRKKVASRDVGFAIEQLARR